MKNLPFTSYLFYEHLRQIKDLDNADIIIPTQKWTVVLRISIDQGIDET